MKPSDIKKPLIVITGPTAAGKSALSISLAKRLNGEIISADSMQVYRGMDIGTAKISKEEMSGVVHHMIDILDPKEPFDVYTFKNMSKEITKDIHQRGKTPIVVGGTGFYIQALAYDVDFSTQTDGKIRERLINEADTLGPEALYEKLKSIDPESAKIIDKNNVKRVIRALEFFECEGYPISEHNKTERTKTSPYDLKYFVLYRDRQKLYEDIDKRVDIMVKEGLVEETRRLYELGIKEPMTSEKALGYREMYGYFRGEYDLNRAIYLIKLNTRHFAKRQITWFKRERDVIWVNKDNFENEGQILDYILEKTNE